MLRIMRWINISVLIAGVASWLSPYVSLQWGWMFSLTGLFFPWILLVNVLFVFFWLLIRKSWFILSLVWIVLSWGSVSSIIGFHGKKDAEEAISIVSFNSRSFVTFDEKGKGKLISKDQLVDYIQVTDADIFCFQELPRYSKAKEYIDYIKAKTTWNYYYQNKEGALGVLSKYPLKNGDAQNFLNKSNGILHVDVDVKGKKIRLFNTHLQSNAVTRIADQLANDRDIDEKEAWIKFKGMVGKYRHSALLRAKQAGIIREQINASHVPIIVCGDFNDVPQSKVYQMIAADNLRDSFRDSGKGLGFTFNGSIPALRIDYILHDDNFESIQTKVLKPSFSDHNPVMTVLKLD